MFTYTSILLQFERPLKLWSTLLTFSSNFSQFHPTFRRIPERLGRPPCLYTWHKATEGLDMLWHQEGSNMSEGATFLLCLCLTFDTVTQQPTGEGTGRRDIKLQKSHFSSSELPLQTKTATNHLRVHMSSLWHESSQVSGSIPHKQLWYWETCTWHKHLQCVLSLCRLLCINSVLWLHSTVLQLLHKSGLLCVFSALFWAHNIVFLLSSLTHLVFYSFFILFYIPNSVTHFLPTTLTYLNFWPSKDRSFHSPLASSVPSAPW